MRISTATQNDNAIRAITEQQTRLAKTQSQVASGKRVQTPADDPAAAAQILQLRRALAETEQHDRNTNTVINRLNFEAGGLAIARTDVGGIGLPGDGEPRLTFGRS